MRAPGPFAVLEIVDQTSKNDGSDIFVVTMMSLEGLIVHTYIDPSNKNFKFWVDIIDLFNIGFGVVIDDLNYKMKQGVIQTRYIKNWNRNEPLINADSKPKIKYRFETQQEVLDILAEELA